MGYITKYGTVWGAIPQTSGRVFWVAPSASYTVEGRTYSASDQNDGLSPERALLTLAQAMLSVTANVGDVIVLLPGTHTMAATVAVNIAGITITGIPQNMSTYAPRMASGGAAMRTTVTAAASTDAINVTAVDVELANLHFVAVSAQNSVKASNAADRLFIHDCTWDMYTAADSTATVAINLGASGTGTTTTIDNVHIRNCYFLVSGAKGAAVSASNTAIGTIIENSTFQLGLASATAWATAIMLGSSVHQGTVIRDCDVLCTATGTAVTRFVDANIATTDGSTIMYRCNVPAGCIGLDATATADAIIVDSYTAGTTGTNTVIATT